MRLTCQGWVQGLDFAVQGKGVAFRAPNQELARTVAYPSLLPFRPFSL